MAISVVTRGDQALLGEGFLRLHPVQASSSRLESLGMRFWQRLLTSNSLLVLWRDFSQQSIQRPSTPYLAYFLGAYQELDPNAQPQ
jgi:hypothetical protein